MRIVRLGWRPASVSNRKSGNPRPAKAGGGKSQTWIREVNIMTQIYANNFTTLVLGRRGENLVRNVVFDIRMI